MKQLTVITAIFWLLLQEAAALFAAETVSVSSLAELAKATAYSGQSVTMKAGLYKLTDLIPLDTIADRRKRQEWQFLTFSGIDNTFDLSGVTIELDTVLRARLRAPIHTDEFLISGNNVTVKGLTITSVGDGKALGGAVLGITGTGNTLSDCTIHVEGSAPYGYGDLFGKGGLKHSAVHVTGNGTRISGCKVFMRSFGHGFYLQEDCADCVFENCSVEGVMRKTDDILEETSGLAFDRKFRTEKNNRSGEARILPGYVKALSEDAFRTYGQHQNLVLKNCTAKNMRGGFELRTKTGPRLERCTALGCERAFWVSTGAVMTQCKGDAQFGPLLYVEGDDARVGVQLLSTEAEKVNVHAIAAIYGIGNEVTITEEGKRRHAVPILVGYGPPGMGENMIAHPEQNTRNLLLRNETTMPVVIGSKASHCQIVTRGPVQENRGTDIAIEKKE